jgi:hypothetical protein
MIAGAVYGLLYLNAKDNPRIAKIIGYALAAVIGLDMGVGIFTFATIPIAPFLTLLDLIVWGALIYIYRQLDVIEKSSPVSPGRPYAASQGATGDVAQRIKKLRELHQSGAITDAEFEAKKAELLKQL